MKNGKAKGLKQINNTSNKGLFRLGTDINTNDYHVLVQNKKEKKTYEMPFSLFNTGGGGGGSSYIPLTGTEVDKPVTGFIEIEPDNGYGIKSVYDSNTILKLTFVESIEMSASLSGDVQQLSINPTGIFINSNNGSGNGITGLYDYTANITDLDYTQKKYVDSAIAANSGGQIAFTKTKAEIDALITGGDLVSGALYEITGVHPTLYDDGTTSGTTVYLRAISGSELEVQGMGVFYNPKYNQAVNGFGIWENKMYGTFSSISGTFDYQNKEAVTANNAATGILLADGMIQFVSGDWSTATSITGDVSSATATVAGFVTPTYSIGDKVIWGGYSWTNVNGNVGASTDVLNLNAEWSKNVYDTSNYNIAYDLIEYDYSNDWISRRYDAVADIDVVFTKIDGVIFSGNSINFHAIQVQQFGNTFNLTTFKGIFNKRVINAYDESINFCGAYQYNLTFGQGAFQSNLTFGQDVIQYNLTFGQDAKQYNLTFGQDAIQYNLTFGQGAKQYNLTFGQDAEQYNLIFGQDANQNNLTFGQNANQNNLTFGQDAYQFNLTFENNASQYNLTFGNNASQYNLTFGNNASQQYLNFAENTQLNYNNQTLNSNIEYVSFRTKAITVPDLSTATYIFDGNIKEVYQRPDGTIKLKFMNNSDVLEVHGIAD